jgi:predicted outer membrane lipoprotein
MTRPVANLAASIATAVITYELARAADLLVLRVIRPPRGEVLLVSDVILAAAFGVVVYLWLNLRATRTRLTSLERAQIVVDTQLSLAAEIQRNLLPRVQAGSNGVRWFGRLQPALRIGGDFYDVIPGDTHD